MTARRTTNRPALKRIGMQKQLSIVLRHLQDTCVIGQMAIHDLVSQLKIVQKDLTKHTRLENFLGPLRDVIASECVAVMKDHCDQACNITDLASQLRAALASVRFAESRDDEAGAHTVS